MARPRSNPTKPVSVRLDAAEAQALAQFARLVGESRSGAAHRALVIGLAMHGAVTQPRGSHCLLPGDRGGLLVFSAGSGDAHRIEAARAAWEASK